MKNEITYTEHNGLYYPNLEFPEQTNIPLASMPTCALTL